MKVHLEAENYDDDDSGGGDDDYDGGGYDDDDGGELQSIKLNSEDDYHLRNLHI
jgi:hypothetical protein